MQERLTTLNGYFCMETSSYFCKVCGKSFQDQGGVNKHLASKAHPNVTSESFAVLCVCGVAFGCELALSKHRQLKQCAALKPAAEDSWTLDKANSAFHPRLTKYLKSCFIPIEPRPALSKEQQVDLSFAYFAVRTGQSREDFDDMVNLLPLATQGSFTKPRALRTILTNIEKGGHYPPTPWDDGSHMSRTIHIPVNNAFHIQSKIDPPGKITLRVADILHAAVESLFDHAVVGDDPNPYVLHATVRCDAYSFM